MNSLIIIKLPVSHQEHVQIFPLPSSSKTCALPFNFALVGDPKNIFYYQRDIENHTDQALNFCYLIDMNIYTQNLLVCNSRQYTYVTGLFNSFFVLQDLIDRIGSYFQRVAFRGTCFLLASNTLCHKFFLM